MKLRYMITTIDLIMNYSKNSGSYEVPPKFRQNLIKMTVDFVFVSGLNARIFGHFLFYLCLTDFFDGLFLK